MRGKYNQIRHFQNLYRNIFLELSFIYKMNICKYNNTNSLRFSFLLIYILTKKIKNTFLSHIHKLTYVSDTDIVVW